VAVDIVPGGKGDFIVKADGKLLWDKRGRDGDQFPAPEKIVAQIAV
jgi:predicted Rdx family selenoprotein